MAVPQMQQGSLSQIQQGTFLQMQPGLLSQMQKVFSPCCWKHNKHLPRSSKSALKVIGGEKKTKKRGMKTTIRD